MMNVSFLKDQLPSIITFIVFLIGFFYVQKQVAELCLQISNLHKLINITNSKEEIEVLTPYNEPDSYEGENVDMNSLLERISEGHSHPESFLDIQELEEEIAAESEAEEAEEAEVEAEEVEVETEEVETEVETEEAKRCLAILKSGKNKGMQCDKETYNVNSLCAMHSKNN